MAVSAGSWSTALEMDRSLGLGFKGATHTSAPQAVALRLRSRPCRRRYVSKAYVETVHWQSEPFKKLKDSLGSLEWVEPMAIKTYQERDVGF